MGSSLHRWPSGIGAESHPRSGNSPIPSYYGVAPRRLLPGGRGEQSCGRCGGPSGGQAPRRSARRAAIIEHVRGARDLDAVRAALLTTFDGFPLQGDTLQPRPRREALLGLVSSIDSDFTRGMRHSGNRSSSESQCPCQTQLSPTLRRPSSRAARSARPRPLPSNRSSASAGTSRCRSARACPTR